MAEEKAPDGEEAAPEKGKKSKYRRKNQKKKKEGDAEGGEGEAEADAEKEKSGEEPADKNSDEIINAVKRVITKIYTKGTCLNVMDLTPPDEEADED